MRRRQLPPPSCCSPPLYLPGFPRPNMRFLAQPHHLCDVASRRLRRRFPPDAPISLTLASTIREIALLELNVDRLDSRMPSNNSHTPSNGRKTMKQSERRHSMVQPPGQVGLMRSKQHLNCSTPSCTRLYELSCQYPTFLHPLAAEIAMVLSLHYPNHQSIVRHLCLTGSSCPTCHSNSE